MIPLKSLRLGFEKQATFNKAEVARQFIEVVGKGIYGTAKIIVKHPIASVATVAGTAGALALANKVLGAYTLFNEQRKRGIMLDQRAILQEIANSVNKPGKESDINPQQPFAVQPLA